MTTRTGRAVGGGRARALPAALVAVVTVAGLLAAPPAVGDAAPTSVRSLATAPAAASLRLVTLDGPGLAGTDPADRPGARARLVAAQDRSLAGLGAAPPVRRWTTALNGYAVLLTDDQASRLASRPVVTAVEADGVRPMAALRGAPTVTDPAPGVVSTARRGGAGVVIGVVDSGVDPDGLVLADGTRLGREPARFRGACAGGRGWTCGDKLVGARWFVDGFGRDRLASSASLSARDDAGHGTAVASVAGGNTGVGVAASDRLGTFAGVAPQARVAAYTACWTAPDPTDDGCATSDLVTAVDRATADRVDVLSVAVGGPSRLDTLDRAMLGAAEADVVVVTAAGNEAGAAYAAHGAPWALTVGAHTTPVRRGRLRLADEDRTAVTGATVTRRAVRDAPLVRGADVAAPGARRRDAGSCRPGSLDAARVEGAMVVCGRGAVSRLEKSTEVDRAGGVAMVLTNRRGADLSLDVHRIPVLHLAAAAGDRLREATGGGVRVRATLEPAGVDAAAPRPTGRSSTGDPAGPLVTPSLLAPGAGVLAAVPAGAQRIGWRTFSGTSAATAVVAGAAARVRAARPGWSADRVRSALTTTALPLDGDPGRLVEGAGRVRPWSAARPGLVYELGTDDLRRYLDGNLGPAATNTPSVLVRGGPAVVTRRVRNVSGSALYFSSDAEGFERHAVSVRPAALRLGPGEAAEVTVRVSAALRPGGVDDGTVTWSGADGSRVRIPVVVSR